MDIGQTPLQRLESFILVWTLQPQEVLQYTQVETEGSLGQTTEHQAMENTYALLTVLDI